MIEEVLNKIEEIINQINDSQIPEKCLYCGFKKQNFKLKLIEIHEIILKKRGSV